jgi:FG-GAP-like repeat
VVVDLDRDGSLDLAVVSQALLVLHGGKGGGSFSPAATLFEAVGNETLKDVAAGDLDGDSKTDLVLLASDATVVLRNQAPNGFADPERIPGGGNRIALADLDGDGSLDFIVPTTFTLTVRLRPLGQPADPRVYQIAGIADRPRIADLNGDGALDVALVTGRGLEVALGRPAAAPLPGQFRRGDVDLDGRIAINDPVIVLDRLFLAGFPPPCADAADANDDGAIDVSDPVAILYRLFLGADPLPPPGPEACGLDPTPDDLPGCETGC